MRISYSQSKRQHRHTTMQHIGTKHSHRHILYIYVCWHTDIHSHSICCYSSAVLWEPWSLWRCEGNEALEACTRLLPNGRVDIYHTRLGCGCCCSHRNDSTCCAKYRQFYSDGWDDYGDGPGDVWGQCTLYTLIYQHIVSDMSVTWVI